MKDVRDILKAIDELEHRGEPYVLATVVRVTGSTYRSPGAHMLITSDGRFVGSISGGCVEHDVLKRAQEVLESGTPMLLTYDTTAEDDILWGMGLGCSGVLEALLEPYPNESGLSVPDALARCLGRHDPGVIATVFKAGGPLGAEVGRRLVADQDGVRGNIGHPALRAAVAEAAAAERDRLLATTEALPVGHAQSFPLPGGTAEVVLEPVVPPVPLLIFGAGNDARPLAHLAQSLGWNVTLVDHRGAYANPLHFPGAEVLMMDYGAALDRLKITPRTLALTMTHNYLHDLAILRRLVGSPVRYLGTLGPRKRTERLLGDLRKEGVALPDDFGDRFFSPVGLDIGAETPEEVALSAIAEMQAVLAGRGGGFLRDRRSPIHAR